MKENIFIIFSVVTFLFGAGVVFSKNPIYSAFNLVLCFFGLAGIYVLWGATFISMIQVLIYTGAIVVLFVFVVMLLDLVKENPSQASGNWLQIVLSGALAWIFSFYLLRILNETNAMSPQGAASTFTLKQVSKLLFTDYLWPFEVLSLFLLAMIIAAYLLTRPQTDYIEGPKS